MVETLAVVLRLQSCYCSLLYFVQFETSSSFTIALAFKEMASKQLNPKQSPVIILSDSDSDVEADHASQSNTQPGRLRKRSASVTGGNPPKGARMSPCQDCNTLCLVQVDRTPSNSGRNVTLLSLPSLQPKSFHVICVIYNPHPLNASHRTKFEILTSHYSSFIVKYVMIFNGLHQALIT